VSRFEPVGIVVLLVLTPGLAAADVVELPSPAARDAQSPNLAAARDGVVMTWLEPGRSGRHRVRFARLLDGRWTVAVTIAESERIVVNWADVPSAVELTALDGRYRARGLQVVGVSVDRERSPAQIRAFLARGKPAHHQWLDRHESLAGAMAVGVLPATFLIDARGSVVWRATGAITATDAALVARIEALLPRGR
jgi:hypothetical protein